MFSLTRYCGQFSKAVSLIPAPVSGIWDTHWVCPGQHVALTIFKLEILVSSLSSPLLSTLLHLVLNVRIPEMGSTPSSSQGAHSEVGRQPHKQ